MKNKKGKHKSVDKELKTSISWLESLPAVEKIVLGLAESARHSFTPGVIRYQMDTLGGIKVKAYGGKGVMDIFIKVSEENKEELLSKIKKRWET